MSSLENVEVLIVMLYTYSNFATGSVHVPSVKDPPFEYCSEPWLMFALGMSINVFARSL